MSKTLKPLDIEIPIMPDVQPPRAERKVWLHEDGYITTKGIVADETQLMCPISSQPVETRLCICNCSWFRVNKGLALCGDKIIGEMVAAPKEN